MTRPLVLSLTIPAFNEENILAEVVRDATFALEGAGIAFELILAENGSRDATPAIADALAHDDPRVRAIHLADPNYGQAIRQGFLASSGEYLAHFSVDWMDFDFLQTALSQLNECDIVVGAKISGDERDRRPWVRRFGGHIFHGMAQWLFRVPVSDTHGIKVLRRDRVIALVERCRYGGEVFDTELIVRAHRAGLRICEVPVRVEEKRPSRSGVLERAWRGLVQLLRLRLTLWREGC